MGYVGNKPALNYTTFAVQHFTTSATTGYTLDNAVTNENDIRLVINNVVQQPGSSYAYTASGTTLTLSAATTSSDTMYCVFLGKAVQTVNPGAGSVGTSQLATDAVTTVKITDTNVTGAKLNDDAISAQDALGAAPADTDEFLVSDAGVLKRVDYSYIKGITQTSFLPTAAPLIINGDMQIAQRGTSTASITSNGFYTCDRWYHRNNSLGTWTQTQESLTSGDAYTDGFSKSIKMDNTTADASPSAGDFARIDYRFEGQNVQLFKKGTANAETYTVAFWVKATKTGTNICQLWDNDNNRSVSKAYTVSSTNTWEYKVVNFPADTTGVMGNDNAYSLAIQFWLGAGTDFTSGTLQQTWAAQDNTNAVVGQVNNADSTSNNWEITGVQMQVGEYTSSDLPPFRHESYGDNLARCQRYYNKLNVNNVANAGISIGAMYGSSNAYGMVYLSAPMRATPTADFTVGTDYFNFNRNSAGDSFDSFALEGATNQSYVLWASGNMSGTDAQAGRLRFNNTSARIAVTAEL